MNTHNKYRLWTFQSVVAVEELQKNGILKSELHHSNFESHVTKSYEWMMNQMHAKRINCIPNTLPIWAWHSCNLYSKAPRLVDARSLLSDIQIEGGIKTIEFECPIKLVLLSNYGLWNSILEKFYLSKDEKTSVHRHIHKRLFATSKNKFKKYDCIQAALPYIKLSWVKDIRKLNLEPGDFSFNFRENV